MSYTIVITEKGGKPRAEVFDQGEITIGRVHGNDIVLPKGNISKRHSRIVQRDGKFIIVDLKSTNGTYVNGKRISAPLVLKDGDKLYIGDFTITLESPNGLGGGHDAPEDEPAQVVAPEPVAPELPPRNPQQLRTKTNSSSGKIPIRRSSLRDPTVQLTQSQNHDLSSRALPMCANQVGRSNRPSRCRPRHSHHGRSRRNARTCPSTCRPRLLSTLVARFFRQ